MAGKWEEQSPLGSVKVRPWYIDLNSETKADEFVVHP